MNEGPDIRAIIAEYAAGDSPSVIARRHGTSAEVIREWLEAAGVQLRARGVEANLPMDRVAKEYRRGDGLPVLGRRYGVEPETIRRRLMKRGVKIRDQRTAQRVRYGRHGDIAGLAAELGVSEQRMTELLLAHGLLFDDPAAEAAGTADAEDVT